MVLTVVNKMNSTYRGWSEIQELVNNGKYRSLLPVGTEIIFQLKDGRTVIAVIRDVDHYQEGELVFGFKRLYFGNHPMNEDFIQNSDGWIDSNLRSFLNEDIIQILPKDLTDIIAKKRTNYICGYGCNTSCCDYLWLPTEYEVCGHSVCSERNKSESQFKSYKNVFERIMMDENAENFAWWTSSFSAVNKHDYVACGLASLSFCEMEDEELGIVPHFLIRKEEIL